MTTYEFNICPICGIHYAVDKYVMDYKRKRPSTADDRGWYCPNGHSLVCTESEADKWRRKAERLEQQIAERDDEIRDRDRQIVAAKGQITKLKNRASNGVCPCCSRHFTNLERHMHTKHPDFAATKVDAA